MFRRAMKQFETLADGAVDLTWSRLRARQVRMFIHGGVDDTGDNWDDWQAQFEDHITISRAYGDLAELAFGLYYRGFVVLWQNNESSLQYLEESFHCYCELNDRFYMALPLAGIGQRLFYVAQTSDQVEVSKGFMQRSLELSREVGDQNEASYTASDLGQVAFSQGQYAEAERYFGEAKANQRERRDMAGLSYSLLEESDCVFLLGEFRQAGALAEEALEITLCSNILQSDQTILAMVGMGCISQDRYRDAERLFKQAMSARGILIVGKIWMFIGLTIIAYHNRNSSKFQQHFQRMIEYVQCFSEHSRRLNQPLWLFAAMAVLHLVLEGKKEWAVELLSRVIHLPQAVNLPMMRWVEKLPLFTRLREQLQAELGQTTYAAAWERGKLLDLDQTAEALLNGFPQSFGNLLSSTHATIQPYPDSLTARELEILNLVAAGLSNRDIADRLVLALGTVKWYITIFSANWASAAAPRPSPAPGSSS